MNLFDTIKENKCDVYSDSRWLLDRGEDLVGVAFIGAGAMADAHALAFQDINNVELVGICARNEERRSRFASKFGIKVETATVSELFELTRADLVVIAVSELAATEIITDASEHPWLILAEKPAGITLGEANELAEIFKYRPEQLRIGYNRRHYSSTRLVLNELNAAGDGPRYIEIRDQESPLLAINQGRPKRVTDNWMFANSIHLVDYFNVFARGELTQISRKITSLDADSYVLNAELSFDSGDSGSYSAIWNAPGPWSFGCWANDMHWEARPLEQIVRRVFGGPPAGEKIEADRWDNAFKPGIRMQAEKAIQEVVSGGSGLPTILDSLKSMSLVSAIYERG